MSRRIERVNELIKRTFGNIVQKEADLPNDALVTVARVDTVANLSSSTVWISVYPQDRAKEILDSIQKQMYDLQGELNRTLDLHPIPRLRLQIDYGAQQSEQIEQAIRRLEEEGRA